LARPRLSSTADASVLSTRQARDVHPSEIERRSHDKLRAVALEMISPARRRQLHRAVAQAIEVDLRDDIEAASPQLAAHYDQAGMVELAIDAYRVAGARAVAVSAWHGCRAAASTSADRPL
jgi:hypothetical protein